MNRVLDKTLVPGKFDRIASTYDLLTGANPGYRRHLVASASRMGLLDGGRILDLCCGTGASTAAVRAAYPSAEITGLDKSTGMLAQARRKTHLATTFVHGDAMDPGASPEVEGPYDAIFMAYGIRNMPDADLCLERCKALLKPGGTICFHEYSVRDSLLATWIWHAVCWLVIIPGGLITAQSTDIYRYLWRSVVDFDGVSAFEDRLRKQGFVGVRSTTMDGWQRGIVHTIVARVPEEPA